MVATRSSTRKQAAPAPPPAPTLAAPPKRAPKRKAAEQPAEQAAPKRVTRASATKKEAASPLKKPAKKPAAKKAAKTKAPVKRASRAAAKPTSTPEPTPFKEYPNWPTTPAVKAPEPARAASPVAAPVFEAIKPVFLKSAMRSPEKREDKKAVAWTEQEDSIMEYNAANIDALFNFDGPLTGCTFFLDIKSAEGEDKNRIFIKPIKDLGGEVITHWLSDSDAQVTHVIFSNGNPSTLQKAAATNGAVKCVKVGWILDCEAQQKRLDEDLNCYRVEYSDFTHTVSTPATKKVNKYAYTPARTPGQSLFTTNNKTYTPLDITPGRNLSDPPSFHFSASFLKSYQPPSELPSTPGSSIFDKTLSFVDYDDDKENITSTTKKVQQTCPPKPQSDLSYISKSPIKPINFAPATAVRGPVGLLTGRRTEQMLRMETMRSKRRAEDFGGITMATPRKKLRFD